MSIHIIVDGYNLIRQSGALSRLDEEDIQLGREALLHKLAAYKRYKPHKITVVFDGANAPPMSPHQQQVKGIKVRFSRKGESADAVIKRMAGREREKALIVSSDVAVVDFSASKGSATISASAFEEKMEMAAYINAKGIDSENTNGWVPTTKKKGPSKRLSKRQRRARIKIRKL